MKKIVNIVFTLTFSGLILAFCVGNVLMPQREFSENENRTLTLFPEVSAQSVLSGEFEEEFESYANDQFAFRDQWVSLKAMMERLSGKKENNGVYFAKNGYLIEKEPKLDRDLIARNVESLVKLDSLGKYNITFALVPTAYEIHQDYLPKNAYQDVQPRTAQQVKDGLAGSNVKFVDPTENLLAHRDEYIYYRTDHHQTPRGSYYVYDALGEALSYTPYAQSDFDIVNFTQDFYGTTWSKATLPSIQPDSIDAYQLRQPMEYHVDYLDTQTESDSLFEMKNLEGKDKYTVFLDGNHAMMEIHSSVGNGKKLAVFKDSYAHSILPFLANHYETIYVLDLRYYSMSPVQYLEDCGVSDVLVLYNTTNFMTDTNLTKIGAFIE